MRGHRAPSRVRCEKGGSAERRSPLPASPVRREERSPTRDRPAIVGSRSNVQGGARGKAALVAARAASTRVSSARAREDTHCLCRRDRLPRPAPTPANHRPRSAPRAGPRADEAPPGPPGDGSRPDRLAWAQPPGPRQTSTSGRTDPCARDREPNRRCGTKRAPPCLRAVAYASPDKPHRTPSFCRVFRTRVRRSTAAVFAIGFLRAWSRFRRMKTASGETAGWGARRRGPARRFRERERVVSS